MIYQLSPLESVSSWSFRVLCTKLGADRTYIEMLRAKALGRHNRSSWDMVDTYGDENCHLQLLANKTDEINSFFKALKDEIKIRPHLKNIQGYNLNLGCPSPDVIGSGGGAALIKRTTKVSQIVTSLCEHTDLPVSIKIRLGLNEREMENKVYLNLIEALNSIEKKNFNEVIVHLKHAGENSKDNFHYDLVLEIVEKCRMNLTLNGGYSDKFLPKEKVYGVMFARAAIKDPLMFSRLKNTSYTRNEAIRLYSQLQNLHPWKEKYSAYLNKYCSLFNDSNAENIKVTNG